MNRKHIRMEVLTKLRNSIDPRPSRVQDQVPLDAFPPSKSCRLNSGYSWRFLYGHDALVARSVQT